MGKTLLTGGTGFIGSEVARLLQERGDDLRLTVRSDSSLEPIEGIDCERVVCDILDRRALRRAMKDVTKVVHVAGLVSLRASSEQIFRTNVLGSRAVFQEALAAGVERVVHTSSAMAIGAAESGSTVDEQHIFEAGGYGIPYVNSKHEAEVEALKFAVAGLPVVIANPTFVLGPGNWSQTSAGLIKRFMKKQIPAYVDGSINVIDIRDAARGILLVDEKGAVGERYILGGRNFTLDRIFADLGRLTDIDPPALKLPLSAALAFAKALEQIPGKTPPLTTVELRATSKHWAYRSTKAKRELGWKPMPHEEMLEATTSWYRDNYPDGFSTGGSKQPLALRTAGFFSNRLRMLQEDLGL